MKTIFGKISISASRSNGKWLTLMVCLVVLAPTIFLLWLMNQAAQNERLAVRQRLMEVYRGHLILAEERLTAHWRQLDHQLSLLIDSVSPSSLFHRQVLANSADSIICYDTNGNPAYPANITSIAHASDPFKAGFLGNPANLDVFLSATSNMTLVVQTMLAEVSGLLKEGKKEAALKLLSELSSNSNYQAVKDEQGRLLAANAELLALEILAGSNTDMAKPIHERLTQRLLRYEPNTISSSQRLFLMQELKSFFPDQTTFPTFEAEDLAARYLETVTERVENSNLHPSPMEKIWQLPLAGKRVLLLFRDESLRRRVHQTVSQALPDGIRVECLSPTQEQKGALVTVNAGIFMPGWQLALNLTDPQLLESAADKRVAYYTWAVAFMIGTMGLLGLLALGLIRRQMALTQLKNDLVANVTHELKTPLSSMRLLVDTLLDSPKIHEQTAREYLQLIANENARLSRVIDNFLAFSRIERKKQMFEFKEVSPDTIINAAISAVGERLQQCHFQTHLEPNLPFMNADPDALTTVLINLLDNALKYTGDNKEITLTSGIEKEQVFFCVQDNGIGLSPHDVNHIFDRFYRVSSDHSPAVTGCGLGLSIVHYIIQAHGGDVRISSQPGGGSKFTILIPAAKACQE